MYKTHFFFFLSITLLFTGLVSCSDPFENYSKSPGDILSFSSDTIRFDTVLTTVNSPVRLLMVYNRNDDPLLISSVSLEKGGTTGFKINVDGQSGSLFTDVEIRAKDSLYVLIDIKPLENGLDELTSLSDQILFVTNGVTQKVVLDAWGQDVFLWKGKTFASDTVIRRTKPFLIRDSLVVEENVTLEVQEGVTFYMDNDAELIVRGCLKLQGAPENPVTIRASRTDNLFADLSYDQIPGQWNGILFASTSFGNEFNHARIRNGRSGLLLEASESQEEKLRMSNTVLTNFSGYLIRSVNCRLRAENCELSNSRFALLNLTGGDYEFTHCTLANYMPSSPESGWANSNNETVYLSDTYYPGGLDDEGEPKSVIYPMDIRFYNSIVWGKAGERSYVTISEKEEGSIRYYFGNCLITNREDEKNFPKDQEFFVNCLFNKDPRFRLTNGFRFDFRLDEESPAIQAADSLLSMGVPVDMNGIGRFDEQGPDIGAYEYVGEEDTEE